MTKKTPKKRRKPIDAEDIKDFLKNYPPPPGEHTYELKMEKQVKHMLKELEKEKN